MADGLYQPPEKAQSGRITEMPAEFERKTKEIIKDPAVEQKLAEIVGETGNEFPCLSCPSKDECGSYEWFLKWFGNQQTPAE
jgi:hypothetical protein